MTKSISDVFVWTLIAILTVLAFTVNYVYLVSVPIKVIMWIGWCIVSLLLFLFYTSSGKKAFLFAQESNIEMRKVVWPSRPETVQTTMIVMAMVAFTGFVLWVVDMSMMWIIGKITHLG